LFIAHLRQHSRLLNGIESQGVGNCCLARKQGQLSGRSAGLSSRIGCRVWGLCATKKPSFTCGKSPDTISIGEAFTIDAWGNLTGRGPVAGKSSYEFLSQAALTNNRLTGFGYDASGNMTSNGGVSYSYDAENRLLTTAGVTYTYDGDGQRVKKSSGTLYWTGTGSDTLSESNLTGTIQKEYIYFNGKRVARRDVPGTPTVKYYFSDHLGSASVITNNTGTMPPLEESDYYPYGGEIAVSGSDSNRYKFTGKERDSESGLDNFGARYDASSLGRFMSADPGRLTKHLIDPQGLNRYGYTRNNPLAYVDPDGKDWQTAWSDLKTFANSLYTKVSVGAGIGGKSKVGTGEAKLELVYKNTIQFSTNSVSLTQSMEASAESGVPGGPSVGKSVGAEQTVRSVNSDGTVTGPEPWHAETDQSAGGGGTNVNSSTEQVGVGIEEGAGLVGGVEVGATIEGVNALKDAVSNVKDEIVPPSPPPPPTPLPPSEDCKKENAPCR
jgi:RHS repeat-associated protein